MAVQTACEKYLHEGHDSGLFLAVISEALISEDPNLIASTLLQEKYECILKENGWDLLTLLTRYLQSTDDSPVHLLINNIIKVCSPKEMYLALMEQFEMLDSINTFTILLPLLGNVLQSIPDTTGYLIELQVFVKRYSNSFKKKALTDIARAHKLQPLHLNPEEEEELEQEHTNITLQHYVDTILTFLNPFVKEIDHSYTQTIGNISDNLISTLQRTQLEVISILMELLDTVLITHNNNNSLTIMDYILRCHYGGMALIEWRNNERREGEESIHLSLNGLAGFTYILLTHEQCRYYLPHIIHPIYLLQVSLFHVHYCLTEFGMSHNRLAMNGLVLFEKLLKDISKHSLPSSLLEDALFGDVAITLCHSMYRCPFDQVRKCCYELFLKFISSFSSNGRYLFYKKLFHEMTHPGIQGLLIHQLKEEVNTDINYDGQTSIFLGESLCNLYRHFLTASPQMDVLTDYDKLLGGLNFMRYLLLIDPITSNKTLIWSCYQQLTSDFLCPLRLAVNNLQGYCKAKLQSPTENNVKSEIEVDVSIIGKGTIPELSAKEETQTLQYSLHRLDIILSVLARVEELFTV